MTAESIERNKQLYKDYLEGQKEGRSIIWLVMKYQISSSRIFEIIKSVKRSIDNSDK